MVEKSPKLIFDVLKKLPPIKLIYYTIPINFFGFRSYLIVVCWISSREYSNIYPNACNDGGMEAFN